MHSSETRNSDDCTKCYLKTEWYLVFCYLCINKFHRPALHCSIPLIFISNNFLIYIALPISENVHSGIRSTASEFQSMANTITGSGWYSRHQQILTNFVFDNGYLFFRYPHRERKQAAVPCGKSTWF